MTTLEAVLQATRPRTLGISLTPVLFGAGWAYQRDEFNLLILCLTLASAVCLQITANYANDLFDFLQGTDGKDRLGPPRVTALGIFSPETMGLLTLLSAGLAVLFGFPLVLKGGIPILCIGLTALVAAVAYTAGPYPLGKHGLGELFVFLYFGPAAVLGTYYLQAGPQLLPEHLLTGCAVGMLGISLLSVNNLRDYPTDKAAGKRTLTVRYGETFGKLEIAVSTAVSLLFLILAGCISEQPLLCILSALPLAPLLLSFRVLLSRNPGQWLNGMLRDVTWGILSCGMIFFLTSLLIS